MTQVANDAAQPQGGRPNRSDPREFFQLLLRHKWILLACVILIPLATYLVSTRLPKTYEASAVLQLQSVGGGQSLPGRRRPVRWIGRHPDERSRRGADRDQWRCGPGRTGPA